MRSIAPRPSTRIARPDPLQRVVVVGLGFAGLPTAVAIADAGHETVGLDLDPGKVARVNAGEAVSGVAGDVLGRLIGDGLLRATTDPSVIREADVVLISVPTPIDDEGRPDERALSVACQVVLKNLSRGALVVLQSTVVPGLRGVSWCSRSRHRVESSVVTYSLYSARTGSIRATRSSRSPTRRSWWRAQLRLVATADWHSSHRSSILFRRFRPWKRPSSQSSWRTRFGSSTSASSMNSRCFLTASASESGT